MATLPIATCSLLVRTDFSSERAWQQLAQEATAPYDDGFGHVFQAEVESISNPALGGATWEAVKAAVPVYEQGPSVLFIADATSFAAADHPILVVDLLDEPGNTPFRCVPSELWAVDANLNVANMSWEDFAEAVDRDGVFRGFRE